MIAKPGPGASTGAVFPPTYVALVQAVGAQVAQYTRETFEIVGETARCLLNAGTFEEIVRLQTDFAKRSVEGFVARSAKLSEFGYSLFGAWTACAKL